MLNRADTDFERQVAIGIQPPSAASYERIARACRELTVGEEIDERIRKAERTLKSLHDLKGSLPQNFLNSGASRIGVLLETRFRFLVSSIT